MMKKGGPIFVDNSITSATSTESSGNNSTGTSTSCVSFGTVEFREHAYVLGDNPSTRSGPSMEIDWEMQSSSVIDLDQYEDSRYTTLRRSKEQLLMPESIRTSILLDSGCCTMREIREVKERRSSSNNKKKSVFKRMLSRS